MKCKWLPELYEYPDWNNYAEYESKLYTFFKKLYWYNSVYFNDKKLVLKKYPMDSNTNREESFYHLTCKVYKEAGETKRDPDPERMVRIEFPKAFVENYSCSDNCCSNKPLYWTKYTTKNKFKNHIIFHENYLVVVEDRGNYFLLITGYYVHKRRRRIDLIEEYEKYKSNP